MIAPSRQTRELRDDLDDFIELAKLGAPQYARSH
jgi:hypothetical protein